MKKSTFLSIFVGLAMIVAPSIVHAVSKEATSSNTGQCANIAQIFIMG